MLRKQAPNGAVDGAFIVLFGIVLGALFTLVVQQYAKQIAMTITAKKQAGEAVVFGRARVTRDDGR